LKRWMRITLILAAGLAAAGITFVLNRAYISEHTRFENVVIAMENTYPYSPLQKYQLAKRVKSSIPEDAVLNTEFLTGKKWYAGHLGIGEGDIIRKSRIKDSAGTPFGEAVALEGGKVLVGVKTDQVLSAGGSIKPGVLVNAIVFIPGDGRSRPDDIVITPEREPLLGGLLIKDVQNADSSAPGGKGREALPVVAVIETSMQAAQKLVLYQETGKVYLAPVGVNTKTVFRVNTAESPVQGSAPARDSAPVQASAPGTAAPAAAEPLPAAQTSPPPPSPPSGQTGIPPGDRVRTR